MTVHDLVREIYPDASVEWANRLLWEHTSFPFGMDRDNNVTFMYWLFQMLCFRDDGPDPEIYPDHHAPTVGEIYPDHHAALEAARGEAETK